MPRVQAFVPCLWFDDQAEQAAEFYTSVFDNSRILSISRYSDEGQEIHGRPAGSAMTVEFELDGQRFTALNGGPVFQFNEAVSFQIFCETQEELDYFWEKLSAEGDPQAQQCGWLKDRYGLSWQVVPTMIKQLFQDHTSDATRRVMSAMLSMKKLDIAMLRQAQEG